MHRQQVNYLLPEGPYWYNYISKKRTTGDGEWQEAILGDMDQATFIKGGSIIPILLHEDCVALLTCYQNPIRLEVYLDEDDSAKGWLYADDGTSFDYQEDGGSANVQYKLEGNMLTSNMWHESSYEFPETQRITEVVIYGFHSKPADVICGGYEVDYAYAEDEQALLISGDYLHAQLNDLNIEIVWN